MGRQGRPHGAPMAGKSTFGPQAYSHRESFPVISFTKGTNEQRAKMYDKALSKRDVSTVNSPGPARYQLPQLLGTTGRLANFTTVEPRDPVTARADSVWSTTRASSYYARNWNITSFGRDVGVLNARPCYSFGTSTKDVNPKALISKELSKTDTAKGLIGPGPGGIDPKKYSSFGSQTISKRKTSHNATFGRSKRWGMDHDEGVPGPGSYDC
eukprot:jgi/Tetstr1/459632/TSEL_004988.t1